uniref:GPI mannosyltransferase 3 n=1 Tax=Ciona intestinalis TaxID=7719 RepID=UPI000180BAFC|nr:GPI mannosyltransferase 3 [Ciona intestinalis]|eukprot:XP_009861747.1 GPI mannosyltransferase 3 [Ciona intestinalis]
MARIKSGTKDKNKPTESGAKNKPAETGPKNKNKPTESGSNDKTWDEPYLHIFLVTWRLVNVMFVQSWFVPDEYWQSVEIAHRHAFGFGYQTWEWKVGIRSYLHPLMFSCLFYIQKWVGLDHAPLLIIIPRVAQSLLSAAAEWKFYLFLSNTCGRYFARWAMFSLLTSWFWWYCATRTLINTFEINLVCFALYYLGCDQYKIGSNYSKFVFIAAFAFMLRPTIITVWLPLFCVYFYYFCLAKPDIAKFSFILFRTTIISTLVFLLSTFIDMVCHGRLLSVHFNFFLFNIFNNKSTFYGSHPFHWYLTQGIPTVVGTHLPFIMIGIYNKRRSDYHVYNLCKLSLLICTFTVLVYSIPGHKEFRFLLCILPFLHILSTCGLLSLPRRCRHIGILWLLLTNIPMAIYTGLIHQSAPNKVMKYLREDLTRPTSPTKTEIMFLCPCHSTPYYASLHQNITMRFLTCEPNLDDTKDYLDEADIFFSDPVSWLEQEYKLSKETRQCGSLLPNRLVMFDVLYDKLEDYFTQCYKVCFSTFHTHFSEGRVGSHMLVLCRF